MFGKHSFNDTDEDVHIDLSPMIDCIFILLIFFIVTTVFVEETGVTVNKPDVGGASQLEKNSILLAVTGDDKVIYGGKSIGIQGVQAAIRPMLAEDQDMPVIIQGDKDSTHGMVQQVHGQALLAGVGRDKISISTK